MKNDIKRVTLFFGHVICLLFVFMISAPFAADQMPGSKIAAANSERGEALSNPLDGMRQHNTRCGKGTTTYLECNQQIAITPRHDVDMGSTELVLRSIEGDTVLKKMKLGELWNSISFNPRTRKYLVGVKAEHGVSIKLLSLIYVDEEKAVVQDSVFGRLRFEASASIVSPDSRYLVFISYVGSTDGLFVIDLDTDKLQFIGKPPAPPPLTPEELAFNKERAASEEDDPLYPYKMYNDNDGWEWVHSERNYTDMDPNILSFPKPDILQVSYGKDTFKRRAKKRTIKTWDLKKLFAKPGIMTIIACDFKPAGSVEESGITFENCAYVNDKEEAGIFDGHLKYMNFGNGGLASVILKNGQAVYVNREGKTARVHNFDNGADYFVEGLARTVRDGKFGFINEKLDIIIAPQYDFAFPFSNGTALVCNGCRFVTEGEHTDVIGGKWGYINKDGVVIVPVQYEQDKLPSPPNTAK